MCTAHTLADRPMTAGRDGLDHAKREALMGRFVEMMNGSATLLCMSLGHRTGLFDAMAGKGPLTICEIAKASGQHKRYVREWLGAMVTSRLVEHDPQAKTYWLSPEAASLLTRAATPDNFAGMSQWFSVLGGVEDRVLEAFKTGAGVPYEAYGRFHEVMAEESAQSVVSGLEGHVLPLVPGLRQKLEQGIDVLDVGCGAGRAMIHLAGLFPNSRFVGYDFSKQAIEMARAEAKEKGLTNVRFEVVDAAAMNDSEAFDFITTFDAVHDQARPDLVLSNIHRALRPGGTYLAQDIKASSEHAGNLDQPFAPFIYTISLMHCMSVSLACGGMGLGAAWGRELALAMFQKAGFGEVAVNELEHDPLNYWYVMGK